MSGLLQIRNLGSGTADTFPIWNTGGYSLKDSYLATNAGRTLFYDAGNNASFGGFQVNDVNDNNYALQLNFHGTDNFKIYRTTGAILFYSSSSNFATDKKLHVGAATNPTHQLQVTTATDNYGIVHTDGTRSIGTYLTDDGPGYGYVGTVSATHLVLNAGGSIGMIINQSTGNVIFGDDPALATYKLTVKTAASVYGIMHSNGTVNIGTYTDSGAGYLGTQSNHPLAFFTNNGAVVCQFNTNLNIGLNGFSYGSGVKVMSIGECTTVPTTNPTAAIVNYVSGGVWYYRDTAGNTITI